MVRKIYSSCDPGLADFALSNFIRCRFKIRVIDNYLHIGDVELIAKLDDELGHEKASGLGDLSEAVKNIETILSENKWEVGQESR